MNLAPKINAPDKGDFNSGTVRFLSAGEYVIESPTGVIKARLASGCLLEPGPGDRVLYWEGTLDANYILCVLERNPDRDNVMSLTGNLSFHIRNGSLNMKADSVEIAGNEKISMDAPELGVSAGQAHIAIPHVSYVGKMLDAACEKVHLTARTFDSVVERLTQRAKSSFRWVSEMEQVQAGRIRTVVAEAWSLVARKADLKAGDKIKIKGKRIDLG